MKFIVTSSKPSTRRPNEFTTWMRTSTQIGALKVGNSGWIESTEPVAVGTVIELSNVRFQSESFAGREGQQVTCNHIVAQ
jgi:hypothetical protein